MLVHVCVCVSVCLCSCGCVHVGECMCVHMNACKSQGSLGTEKIHPFKKFPFHSFLSMRCVLPAKFFFLKPFFILAKRLELEFE